MAIKITKILHASLLVEDIDRALEFYQGILGLGVDPARPDLGYPGAWLNVGEQQIHLLQLPNPDSRQRPEHGGHDRHIALQVESIEQLKHDIEKAEMQFTTSKSRSNVIFVRDLDGNALELIGISE
ncbi:MAG: VOC family protein [Thioalkalispiraceae bacterium]|jgi:glyoxylase I family protein